MASQSATPGPGVIPSQSATPGPGVISSPPEPGGPLSACPHRGALLGEITGGCGGRHATLACAIHGRCVRDAIRAPWIYRPLAGQAEQLPACPAVCNGCSAGLSPRRNSDPATAVSVIVPCHNYGRYLAQCLDSILLQDHAPAHVIVVDDASTDDTAAVCARYADRRVRYLRTEFKDVAPARNAGVAALPRTPYLLFVDADDILPHNYITELLAGMTAPNIGATYARMRQFENSGRDLGFTRYVVPHNLDTLRRANYATAASLVRRQAFDQVGGWRSYRWGLHDWDLWLRITAAGWQLRLCERAVLQYRIHGQSMSDGRHGHYECGADVLSTSQLTTIVTLFCGRTWALDRWAACLEAVQWNRDNLHLVAVDNSRDAAFGATLRARLAALPIHHTYLRDDRRATEDVAAAELADSRPLRIRNTYAMGVHLGRLYALAGQYLPASTANVWSLEDDVLVPPDALYSLSIELFRYQAAAVSGVLRSRFRDDLLSWTTDKSGSWQAVRTPPDRSQEIVATGFFCLLVKRDCWANIAWRPGISDSAQHPYYDWAACQDLTSTGRKLYLVGHVRCGHLQADGSVLHI